MRPMRLQRWTVGMALTGVMLLLAACGSSSSSTKATTPPTTAAPTTTTMDAATAKAQIEANWTKFFDGSNPDTNSKLAVLENAAKIGDAYKQAEAKAGASASQTSTKVNAIELLSVSDCNDNLGESVVCAKVTYDLLVGGKPALSNQIGYAVYDNGVWKVSAVTDCALSHLGGVDCPA